MAALALTALIALFAACSDNPQASMTDPRPHPYADRRLCLIDNPPTAGNRVTSFLGDVQQGRVPPTSGGVDDPFGCAYDQLCDTIRTRVSESAFRTSRGEAVSRALAADSWFTSSPYNALQRALRDQHSDDDTLDPALRSTWMEVDMVRSTHIDADTVVTGSERHEKWRVALIREHGTWRVCGFTSLGSWTPPN